MVFAAFEKPGRAGEAFARLKDAGFEEAGFSVIGPHTERSEPSAAYPDQPELNELVNKMNLAPTLTVEGKDVACAGALPALLDPSPTSTFQGLRNAFKNAGASEPSIGAFEQVVRRDGLILGVAMEGPSRAAEARSICSEAGAVETTALEVPDREDRPGTGVERRA